MARKPMSSTELKKLQPTGKVKNVEVEDKSNDTSTSSKLDATDNDMASEYINDFFKKLEIRLDKDRKQLNEFISLELKNIEARLERKLDVIANVEKPNAEQASSSSSSKKKSTKETPLNFLNRVLRTDIEKYIDVLYSKEELEQAKNTKSVIDTNGVITKQKKLISTIYGNYIKGDKTKDAKLKDLMSNESNESNE